MCRLSRRLWVVSSLTLLGLAISACGLNAPQLATQVVTIPPEPTNTLAPLITMTPRFTATPIPTSTFIPTATLPPTETPIPAAPTATQTPVPAGPIRGSVNFNSQTVNVRAGPSLDFRAITRVPQGTPLLIIGFNETREWYYVVVEGGPEGWISSDLVTVANPTIVPVITSADLTRRAQQPEPVVQSGTVVATLRPRLPGTNDVLAYCDLPQFRGRYGGRTLARTATVNVYWNWYARTPEQIQDHLDYGRYEVGLEAKEGEQWRAIRTFENWRNYQTGVIRQGGLYNVYWYIPLDILEPGEYRVNYKLTWTQKVDDGEKTFGPGGDEEINTGSCVFTIR